MRRRVVCGLFETIATLPPQSAFTSVDLPTFGRPATATNPVFNSEVPGVRQQVRGRVRDDFARAVRVGDLVEPELVQPLAAAAARRRGDPDRLEVAGLVALAHRLHD